MCRSQMAEVDLARHSQSLRVLVEAVPLHDPLLPVDSYPRDTPGHLQYYRRVLRACDER
jgi:hypothetical protein